MCLCACSRGSRIGRIQLLERGTGGGSQQRSRGRGGGVGVGCHLRPSYSYSWSMSTWLRGPPGMLGMPLCVFVRGVFGHTFRIIPRQHRGHQPRLNFCWHVLKRKLHQKAWDGCRNTHSSVIFLLIYVHNVFFTIPYAPEVAFVPQREATDC